MSNLGNQQLGDIILGNIGESVTAGWGQAAALIISNIKISFGQSQALIYVESYKQTGQAQASIIIFGYYQTTVLSDGPTHYWPLNESSGTTAHDIVGNEDSLGHLNATFGSASSFIAGETALSLASGYVYMSEINIDQVEYTLEIWFKTSTIMSNIGMMGRWNSTGAMLWFETINSIKLVHGGGSRPQATGTFNDGNWHHLVGTYEGTTASIYLDGSLVDTQTVSTPGNPSGIRFELGAYQNGAWLYIGHFAHAAYYDYALDATQVLNHFNSIEEPFNMVTGQAQSRIKNTYNVHGQSQVSIKQTYPQTGQAQADIKQVYTQTSQANAQILGAILVFGQAQATIKSTVAEVGQAQAQIKQIYYALGQANALIGNVGRGFGQAQASIKTFYTQLGQAQSEIKQTYYALGQAEGYILPKVGSGQAQAFIESAGIFSNGQAQATIAATILWDTFTRISAITTNDPSVLSPPDVGPNYTYFQGDGASVNGGELESVLPDDDYAFHALSNSKVFARDLEAAADFLSNTNNVDATYGQLNLTSVGATEESILVYLWNDLISLHISFIGTVTAPFTPVADTIYRLKVSRYGTLVRAKVWDVSTEEPAEWNVTATSDGAKAPYYFIELYQDSGEFAGTSTILRIDNLLVTSTDTPGVKRNAQAQALINSPIKQKFGQARALIIINRISGQAQARIVSFGVNRYAQAQALITNTLGYAQAQARIKGTPNSTGQANAYIIRHLRGLGQAQALIKVFTLSHGQALAKIDAPMAYGQAQAFINQTIFAQVGQAQAAINQTQVSHGQARARIRPIQSYGQAKANIKRVNRSHGLSGGLIYIPIVSGQAVARIIGTEARQYAQAQTYIYNTHVAHGLARAFVQKSTNAGQAQARIISFASLVQGNARAKIFAKTLEQNYGQSQGYIKRTDATGQAAALIGGGRYLVKFNNHQFPGYAFHEEISSITRLQSHGVSFEDGSLSEYLGLENKRVSVQIKAVGSTYIDVKNQVQNAVTIARTTNKFSKLYIHHYDKYYEGIVSKISTEKTVGQTMRHLDYSVEFETRPWLIADKINTITGTGTIDTDQVLRNIDNGGWTPAKILVTGTDVTISGYTAAGDFTGYISVSGVITDLQIDTNSYTATINGENANSVMLNANYAVYVGPGKTIFDITGASSCDISWQDRWYL